VILGYLGMAVWVMMSVGIAWKLLGEDFALHPETGQATGKWIALNLPLGFVGAMLGGWLAASIAKAKAAAAVRVLAIFVVAFGLMLAASEVLRDPASAPPADDDAAAAMMQAKQPTWYTFLIPFLGFAGVMTGGTIRSRAASG
jgi:hypothetical protein